MSKQTIMSSTQTKIVKKVKLVIVETPEEHEPDDCVADDGKHNLDEFGHCIRCCECKKCIKILEETLDDSEDEEDDEDIDVYGKKAYKTKAQQEFV